MSSRFTTTWSDEADKLLARLYDEEQLSPQFIAARMGKTTRAIAGRLTKLRREGKVGPARGRGGRRNRIDT